MKRLPLYLPVLLSTGLPLPFSITFSGASVPPQFSGANLSMSGGKLLITPTQSANLILNPTFTTWTGGNPNSWSNNESVPTTEISQVGTGEGHGGAGSGMCNLYSVDGTWVALWQVVLTAGAWHYANFGIDTVVTGGLSLVDSGSVLLQDYTTTGSKNLFFVSLGGDVTGRFDIRRKIGAAADVTFDNVVVKSLTASTMLAKGLRKSRANAIVKAAWSITADQPAGVMARLDSATSPQNFLLALHDRTNAKLYKCVNGTYTQLISQAAAYAAYANVEIRCNGTTVQLYYNDVQIGSDQTVSDTSILYNRLHLPWSTSTGCLCGSFSISPF